MSLASSLAISLGGLRDKGHIKLVAFFSVDAQAEDGVLQDCLNH